MKLGFAAALLAVFGGTAHAQALAPPPASPPRPATAPCTPIAFAKGQCDTLDATVSSAPIPAQGLSLALRPDAQAQAEAALHVDPNGQQAFEKAASEWRAQNAAGPTPGGVPSIRPLNRPAVVVPLLTF